MGAKARRETLPRHLCRCSETLRVSDRCHANGLPAPPPDEAMAVDRVLQRDFPRVRPERLNYLVNISLKLRYLYVEVPKVACSSIKRTLQQLEDENRSPPEDVHDRDASPLMAPYDSLSLYLSAQHDPRFRRFAFVRNPFTRTLSCYLDKCVQSPWERARLLPELGLSGDTIPTMHEFLLAVQRQPTPQMDIHWLPQAVILEGLCEPRFIG